MKTLFFLIFQIAGLSSCLSANPRWTMSESRTHVPPLPDLEVRWEATNQLPQQVWIYQLLPNRFSPTVISNAMVLCGFTEKDRIENNQDGMTFQSADGIRKLSVSYAAAKIRYHPPEPFTTNLAQGVPAMSELPGLTSNLLKSLDIPLAETTGFFKGERFHLWEPLTIFFEESGAITNIAYRAADVWRSLDGARIYAGDGIGLQFGEHGKLTRLGVGWHTLKREKSYPTASLLAIQEYLKQGKAFPYLLPMNVEPINWETVKRITIKEAELSYCAGSTDKLYPYLHLSVIVDTGQRQVKTELDCPIFDESQL